MSAKVFGPLSNQFGFFFCCLPLRVFLGFFCVCVLDNSTLLGMALKNTFFPVRGLYSPSLDVVFCKAEFLKI